jgi:dTMP kinase
MSDRVGKGLLIVFEGTDGTGKSTQLQLLNRYLVSEGYPVISTREPTDGRYGKKIRKLYTNRCDCSRQQELELFLADRREHVEQLIIPALHEGKIILCDRYFLSTAAYQGAIGFDPEKILEQNSFAPPPDIALLFQAPIATGLSRITAGRGDLLNDFEQQENLQKVAAIFAAINRPYIRIINAEGSIEEVHQRVVQQVAPLLTGFPAVHRE